MTTLLPASEDMFDSIYPQNIPANAKRVAGYVDGAWPWMLSPGWLPNAQHVTISAVGVHIAQVADCENGDLSPASLVTYIQRCRAAGVNTIGYCNYGTWGAAQAAFNKAGIAQPPWWIALYDGFRSLPILNGIQAVAKQYADPGPYDLSCVSEEFVSITNGGFMLNDQQQTDMYNAVMFLQNQWGGYGAGWLGPNNGPAAKNPAKDVFTVTDVVVWCLRTLQAQSTQISGVDADVKAIAGLDPKTLETELQAALTAAGWTAPPAAGDIAASVLAVFKTQLAK